MLTAEAARASLSCAKDWSGVATYMLWNRKEKRPIYCGTARTSTRLLGHLHKDDLANRPVGKTHVNSELRAYCLAQPRGWLGVSYNVSPSEIEAKLLERQIISHYGIRRLGGQLFNQRMTG